MEWEYRGRNCLLSCIAVLTAFFYVTAGPLQESTARNTKLHLAIENSEKSPLQIVSATIADIVAPTQRNNGETTYLVNPKIALKNDSDSAVSLYVLEFRKAGFASFYLTRTDVELAPKEIDSIENIETNSQNIFLSPGRMQSAQTDSTWTVRINTVRFKDGNIVRLHVNPIVGLQPAVLIKRVEPEYPALAKRARVQGQVLMLLTVDAQGNVTETKIISGSPLLKDAAITAVKQFKYRPALVNGEPTTGSVSETLNFKLK
jgi:TonB family protein